MRTILIWILMIVSWGFTACARSHVPSAIEFEPHLWKPFKVNELYGVGFEGYQDPNKPSNAELLGYKQGVYTRHHGGVPLVYVGEPRIVLISRDGEKLEMELEWFGEPPPEKFTGKIFIRIFQPDQGLIHWSTDPYAHWDYLPGDKR